MTATIPSTSTVSSSACNNTHNTGQWGAVRQEQKGKSRCLTAVPSHASLLGASATGPPLCLITALLPGDCCAAASQQRGCAYVATVTPARVALTFPGVGQDISCASSTAPCRQPAVAALRLSCTCPPMPAARCWLHVRGCQQKLLRPHAWQTVMCLQNAGRTCTTFLLGCGALARCLRSSASFCSCSEDIMSCDTSRSSSSSDRSSSVSIA